MAGLIQFAIPSDWRNKQEWEINGVTFRISGTRNVAVLGKSVSAQLILSEHENVKSWYLYSESNGLIAFGAKGGELSKEFWLESSCGFGANSECEKKALGSGKAK
jgi:hypothetical protein